jgi:hypothetical protein
MDDQRRPSCLCPYVRRRHIHTLVLAASASRSLSVDQFAIVKSQVILDKRLRNDKTKQKTPEQYSVLNCKLYYMLPLSQTICCFDFFRYILFVIYLDMNMYILMYNKRNVPKKSQNDK